MDPSIEHTRRERKALGGTFCEERLTRDDDRWRRRELDLNAFIRAWRKRQQIDAPDEQDPQDEQDL